MRIRTQIIAIMVLIMLLVLVPLIIFLNYQIKAITLSKEELHSYEYLDSTHLLVQIYINTVLSRMENLAKELDVIEAGFSQDDKLLAELSDKFSTIVDTSTTIENIGFHDENCIGIVADKNVMQAIKGLKGYDFSSRVYCKPTISTQKTYISPAFISMASKQPVLSATAPVFSGGKMEGYIVGIVNVANLHSVLTGLEKENYLILIDREGNAFIDTRYAITETKIDKNPSEVSAVNDKLKENNQGTFELGQSIISFKKYEDYSIILVRPKEGILMIQKIVFNIMTYSLIFIILLIIASSFLFSRIITKPIENLTKKVSEITTGNLEIQLGKSSISEIQYLTDSLNRILASMKLAILRTGISKEDIGLGEAIRAKKEAEERYKALVVNSPDCIKLFDLDGSIIFINEAGLKEHNLKSLDEAKKWRAEDSLVPEDKKKFQEAFKGAIKGEASTFELIHTKVGSNRERCLESFVPVRDSSGEIAYIFGVSRDISELFKTKEASEKKTKELERFANLSVGREKRMIELKKKIKELEEELKKRGK
ncbi:MAG TPA: PAS domain-containing protein [Candidatus Nanoarchaeia archaeon]|nr:PAS domain-containing protein [Candidatus Nanoarchaeia archaeon]